MGNSHEPRRRIDLVEEIIADFNPQSILKGGE